MLLHKNIESIPTSTKICVHVIIDMRVTINFITSEPRIWHKTLIRHRMTYQLQIVAPRAKIRTELAKLKSEILEISSILSNMHDWGTQ